MGKKTLLTRIEEVDYVRSLLAALNDCSDSWTLLDSVDIAFGNFIIQGPECQIRVRPDPYPHNDRAEVSYRYPRELIRYLDCVTKTSSLFLRSRSFDRVANEIYGRVIRPGLEVERRARIGLAEYQVIEDKRKELVNSIAAVLGETPNDDDGYEWFPKSQGVHRVRCHVNSMTGEESVTLELDSTNREESIAILTSLQLIKSRSIR